MGYIQGLPAPKRIAEPLFFISKIKLSLDEQPVGKREAPFLFRWNYLNYGYVHNTTRYKVDTSHEPAL